MWEKGRVAKFKFLAVTSYSLLFLLTSLTPFFLSMESRDVSADLEGRVVDGSSDPIVGLSVVAISSTGAYLNGTQTNIIGNFSIGLPPLPDGATIYLVYFKTGYFSHTIEMTIHGGTNSLGNLTTTPIPMETETVSGTILSRVGSPVKDVDINMEFKGPEGEYRYETVSDTSGEFSFTVFPAEFNIRMEVKGITVYEDSLEVVSGQGPYDLSVSIPTVPDRDIVIEGYITDGTDPISGAIVALMESETELGAQVASGPDGYYEIEFWSGKHLIISMKEGYDSYFNNINVPSSGRIWQNITLQEEVYWMNGTVRDVEGAPIEGITVQFLRQNSFIMFNTYITDSSGDFHIKVPEGNGYLMAVEESPFDLEVYDAYFQGPINMVSDMNKLIVLEEKGDMPHEMSINFDGWDQFNVSSSMGLTMNASKGSRATIDMMVGNGDLIVDQDEADMFIEMIMAEDGSLGEGAFINDTKDNITVAGNHYDLLPGSVYMDFRNLTGPINEDKDFELRQSSEYTMNGTIPDGTYVLDMNVNISFTEEDEDLKIQVPIPKGWMYLNNSETLHEIFVSGGVMTVHPVIDPDDGDEIDSEWISIALANDTFQVEVIPSQSFLEGEEATISLNITDHVPENVRHYSWEIGDGTTINTTEPELVHTFLENGTYDVTVRMLDEMDRETNGFATFEILNKDPYLNISVMGGMNRTFHEGDPITVQVNASDVPDDPLTYQWGLLGVWSQEISFTEDNSSFSVVVPDDGNITLQVRIMDDDGGSDLKELRFDAQNVAPTFIMNVSGLDNDNRIDQGKTVSFDAMNLSDVSNDTISHEWIWQENVSIDADEDGPSLEIRFLDPGIYNVSFRAYDEDGGDTWYNSSIEVMEDMAFDNDEDGMPRWWEKLHGLDDNDPRDAGYDPDVDNLTNLQEYLNGTDPHKKDTDSDGMPDDFEVDVDGLNPLEDDADGDLDNDGLSNYEEYMKGSDPITPLEEDDTENDSGTLIFLILLITGILIAVGATVLMVSKKKQSSMWYEE